MTAARGSYGRLLASSKESEVQSRGKKRTYEEPDEEEDDLGKNVLLTDEMEGEYSPPSKMEGLLEIEDKPSESF